MSASTSRLARWLRTHRAKIVWGTAFIGSCTVLAGALGQTGVPTKTVAVAPSKPEPPAAATRYSMRCWQYGRLLFDEALAQLPPETDAVTIRLQGADRAQSTYHLVDTRTAVCLVKPSTDRSAWPTTAPGGVPGR